MIQLHDIHDYAIILFTLLAMYKNLFNSEIFRAIVIIYCIVYLINSYLKIETIDLNNYN